jgi:acetyltransferase-like isoleucine patch superfamily enzyme
VHISPGATLCGGVKICNNTHIGANSTIIQYRSIGENAIIGAGSIVTKDIRNNVTAYGNPCKEVRS